MSVAVLNADAVDEFRRLLGRDPSDGEIVLMARAGLDPADYLALASAVELLGRVSRWPAAEAGCVLFGALVGDASSCSKLLSLTAARPGLVDGLALLTSLMRDTINQEAS